ncbi:MAG: hypothetical protein KDB37_09955 [Ilumatobacter sp.]|nr:hypothetical protein [Ilumatobacter sp.]
MIVASAVGTAVWVGMGLVLMVVIWRTGFAMLRALSGPPVAPPEPGALRKVNVRYRCDVCGVELKLTMAPDDDPPPPRHCLEDMVIVPPLYD